MGGDRVHPSWALEGSSTRAHGAECQTPQWPKARGAAQKDKKGAPGHRQVAGDNGKAVGPGYPR